MCVFYFGAIMNSAAVNFDVHISFGHIFSFLLDIYLGVESLGKTVIMFNILSSYLFLYSPEARNGFYVFKWLGKKIKRRIIFCALAR